MIFLKPKPDEEYIEATFVKPLPEKRKMRVKKTKIQMIRPAHIINATKQLPRITTAVQISGIDNMGFDLGTPVMEDAPLLVGTEAYSKSAKTASLSDDFDVHKSL